jgi:hypothetical protein
MRSLKLADRVQLKLDIGAPGLKGPNSAAFSVNDRHHVVGSSRDFGCEW